MGFRDLPSFVASLRAMDDLAVIEAPVDPKLELAEIHRRVIAAGGPALLFKNVVGHDVPVVTNLFGTADRVHHAFGPEPRRFVEDAVRLVRELVPPTLGKLWQERDFFLRALKIGMRPVGSAPVTEVVETPAQLDRIPMITSWPEDGGAFVTLPLVYTESPDGHGHNLGMYRMHRYDAGRTGMHWQIGKGGGFHHHQARQRGKELPVTVFIGGPPAMILGAVAPLPENVPELLLASLLAGERLAMGKNPHGPHRLVADCEYALVGRVLPEDMAPEGPFGDHYGYYSLQHPYPVFHVDAVCRKKSPIWPATVVGKPRQEDFFIGDYLQELLAPLFPMVMPSVKDLWSYGETGYHALAGAVVEERYRREAMASAFRILGEGQLSLTKFLWVIGKPIDLRDPKAVLEHLLERFHPETDLYVLANLSMDTLDYTGPEVNRGSKGVMLGLGDPWRTLPRVITGGVPVGITEAAPFCAGCLVVSGPSYADDPGFADVVAKSFPDWPLVCLVDDAGRTASSVTRFLWTVFTRFEPAADLRATSQFVQRNHLCFQGTVVIDARMKPPYPKELFCDPDTAKTVDRRWSEYFPSGNVVMGDSGSGHLDR